MITLVQSVYDIVKEDKTYHLRLSVVYQYILKDKASLLPNYSEVASKVSF